MSSKIYIGADQERADCWRMATDICRHEAPFDLVIGITRGGGPIGFYLQEFFCVYWKRAVRYANLRTRSYSGIDRAGEVFLGSFEEVLEELGDGKRVLIADDIFDRGKTVQAVLAEFARRLPEVTVKVATLYYKPDNCVVNLKPDYYVTIYSGKDWVVFPRSITEADGAEGFREMGVPEDIVPLLG